MTKLRTLCVLIALLAAIVLAGAAGGFMMTAARPGPARRSVLEVLKRKRLAFLVTDRLTSQILVESDETDLVFGRKEGYLIAKVKLYYGVDLAGLTDDDLERAGGGIIVHLPEPRELDFAVELDSMRFVTKRSGLMVIRDWITNADQERELRGRFRSAALDFMRREDLLPSREAIIERLSGLEGMLSEYVGVKVTFR